MEPKRGYGSPLQGRMVSRSRSSVQGGLRPLDATVTGKFTLIITDAALHGRMPMIPNPKMEFGGELFTGIVLPSILYVGLRHFSPGQFRSATQVRIRHLR
jgi:hypothetical protein